MEAVLGVFIFVIIVIICCRDELRDKEVLRQDTPLLILRIDGVACDIVVSLRLNILGLDKLVYQR